MIHTSSLSSPNPQFGSSNRRRIPSEGDNLPSYNRPEHGHEVDEQGFPILNYDELAEDSLQLESRRKTREEQELADALAQIAIMESRPSSENHQVGNQQGSGDRFSSRSAHQPRVTVSQLSEILEESQRMEENRQARQAERGNFRGRLAAALRQSKNEALDPDLEAALEASRRDSLPYDLDTAVQESQKAHDKQRTKSRNLDEQYQKELEQALAESDASPDRLRNFRVAEENRADEAAYQAAIKASLRETRNPFANDYDDLMEGPSSRPYNAVGSSSRQDDAFVDDVIGPHDFTPGSREDSSKRKPGRKSFFHFGRD